jgi:hypothetical protein
MFRKKITISAFSEKARQKPRAPASQIAGRAAKLRTPRLGF